MTNDNRFVVTKEKLKLAQNKMLDMLLCFQKFCQEYQLQFYLHGGAAIGAVREHGFVPWDDDIDILMPRPDYEQFCKLWNESDYSKRYVFCKTSREVNYHHPCASIRDPNTTFICTYNANLEICHGLALEIGPVDACPDNLLLHWFQLFYAFVFVLFNTQRLPNNKGSFIRKCSWIIYKLFPSANIRYKIWRHAEKEISKYSWEKCNYVAELRGKIKFMLKRYPKSWFDSSVMFDFCGYKIPLMIGYDQYLKGIFGDYMQRPPEKEQIAMHDIVFADFEQSYVKYRNIYYFPNSRNTGGAM